MYYSSSQKEIVTKDPDSYSDFGTPYSSFPLISDPVDICLPGSYFNSEKSSDLRYNNCPILMSQRCATSWDDKCSLYADSLDDPVSLKNFIRATASVKFCHLTPDSTCKRLCQPFNPINQTSQLVCANVGKDTLKDSNDNIDIGWYLPVNMSPDYMGASCSQICDTVPGSSIEPSDIVIDACLKYGFCNDILTNVCQLSSGTSISHPGLERFCSTVSKSSTPSSTQSFKSGQSTKATPFQVSQKKKDTGRDFNIIIFLGIVFLFVIFWMMYNKKRK